MEKALASGERAKESIAATPCIELPPEMPAQQFPKALFCISWRRVISDASRIAIIISALVLIHAVSVGLDELRLLRTGLVEQSTAIRMAIQLQGRDISRGLHALDVNSSVLIDRFDTVSTHLRGQMTDAAKTVAIASKEERKQIVKAIENNADSQKETVIPRAVIPEIRVIPVPGPSIPTQQPQQQQLVPVPQPELMVPEEKDTETQRKGNLLKRLWGSVRRIF